MSDVYPIDGTSPRGQWQDDSEDRYPYRIDIAAEKTDAVAGMKWGRITEFIGIPKRGANSMPFDVDGVIEANLAALFDDDLPDAVGGQNSPAPELSARVEKKRMVRVRQGQQGFRSRLLAAYDNRCAITGSVVEPALQAAHIVAYSVGGTHSETNGLLLRADLHTLFDLNWIALAADGDGHVVEVSPVLAGTEYEQYDGVRVRFPFRERDRPNPQALADHHALLVTDTAV